MDFLKLSADKVLKIHLLEKEILTGSTLKNHRREIDTFVNILTKTLTNVRVTSLISNGASENFGMIAKSIRLIFVGFDDETNYPDCYLQYTALDDSIHFSGFDYSSGLSLRKECTTIQETKSIGYFCTGINGIFTSQVTNDRISALAQSFAEKGFKVTVGIVNNKGETPRYLVPYMCAKRCLITLDNPSF
jgi:hypothetical protein